MASYPNALILLIACCVAGFARQAPAEIVDKVVAVVGTGVITASEVDQQLRLESLLNRAALDTSAENRRQALNRLIERRLIQTEVVLTTFLQVTDEEVAQELDLTKGETFANGLSFERALEAYGLTAADMQDFIRQEIGVLRFIDFRFKTGLEVSSDEVTAYYSDSYIRQVESTGTSEPAPLDQVYDQIAEILLSQRTDAMLDVWLKDTRARTRVVIVEESQKPKGQ